jgi:hypothetical protein
MSLRRRKRAQKRRHGYAKTKLMPVQQISGSAVIIRAIHERGKKQKEALAELDRRGLYLSSDQKRQAALSPTALTRELLKAY